MKRLNLKVKANIELTPGFYRMELASSYLAKHSKPGQFFEIKCPDASAALLRRPFSCHRILEDGVSILYEVAGKGTDAMSGVRPGDSLDVMGPLGTGFKLDRAVHGSRSAILVAGGIGVAPMLALAESLAYSVQRTADRNKIRVFIGACKKEHLLCEEDFKRLGCEVKVATEDGSKGEKGLVTGPLEEALRTINDRGRTTIYACGPVGMLKAVAGIAEKYGIRCQVSMEERMACGIGVCLGCPVRVKAPQKYKMVCKDGPVFDAEEISW
jgi:dihydroorotate dehydrogenase electron transfer subunit